jgi:hypothetical protein
MELLRIRCEREEVDSVRGFAAQATVRLRRWRGGFSRSRAPSDPASSRRPFFQASVKSYTCIGNAPAYLLSGGMPLPGAGAFSIQRLEVSQFGSRTLCGLNGWAVVHSL